VPGRAILALIVLLLFASAASAQRSPSAATVLRARGMQWSSLNAPGLRLHFQRGSPAERDSAKLRTEAVAARVHVLRVANEANYPAIDVFFVDSRTTLRRIAGARSKGLAVPSANYVVLAYNDSTRSFPKHELMHVVTLARWGSSPKGGPWLGEGIAAYADPRCLDYTVDEIAAYLHRRGELLPDRALYERFVATDDLIAYIQAGSLAGFLIEAYGLDVVKTVWSRGNAAIPKGATDAWRKRLAAAPTRPIDWSRLARFGCV